MIDTGPKFYTVPSPPPYIGERGGSVVECRTPEREVRGSRPTSAVLCPWARHFTPRKYWLITQEAMAPSRHDWKIVDWDVKPQHNQPTTPIHDFKVKVPDLELLCQSFALKVFRTSLFPNPLMDLVYIWYVARYWSKILFSTIPIPMHDLKVKVTDLELSC